MNRSFKYFLILLCGIVIFSCGSNPESTLSEKKTSKPERTYHADVIRLRGEDNGYPTPYAHYPRGPGYFKMALIFDSLLERNEKGLIPWLAESYEISPDGRHYLFTVRKGVTWQDGTDLTAEDVRFSLDYANRHPTVWSDIFGKIEAVAKDADGKVRVTSKTPSASMLYNLGTARIIPKHIWETVDRPKEFTGPKAVIGSGPYRLTSYSKAHETYRFEADPGFWGPKPRVTAIEYVPVSEEILAYEKGEIDLTRVPADLLNRYESDPAHIIRKSPAFIGYRLIFNPEKAGELEDLKVRKAIAHAIDKQELVDKVARGAAVPGRATILPPDHIMAVTDEKAIAFDPQAAAGLLAEAGYTREEADQVRRDKNGRPLSYTLLCAGPKDRIAEIRLAEVLRQRLFEVGIQLKVISKDRKTRDSMVRKGDYQLAIIGHGGWGSDPEYLVQRFAGDDQGVNLSPSIVGMKVHDPELLNLFQKQGRTFDFEKRKILVAEIQHLLAAIVPEIPLFYTLEYSVYRPQKYNGWRFMFDHHNLYHGKLSYLAPVDDKAVAAVTAKKISR